jgi:hypothetical protein
VDRAFSLDNGALGLVLILARVTLDHLEALDDKALLLGLYLENLAAPALFGAGDDHDLIPFFDMGFGHN